MSTQQLDRTTMAVHAATRDRLQRHAIESDSTVDEFLNKVLDAHEKQKFWQEMAATTPEEYEAACREDGVWPGDYDYSLEAAHA